MVLCYQFNSEEATIAKIVIFRGKKIRIPKEDGANSYDLKSGKIRFFYTNPQLNKKRELPLRAIEMNFKEYEKHFNINYGEPTFYNEEGNILKDCNGIRLWASQ